MLDVQLNLDTVNSNFLCGVVEGFYGQPWTASQRTSLLVWMRQLGMNTYVYAPKDDHKHRADWRQAYTVEEAEALRGLVATADANAVDFVYAISPGLDIAFANAADVAALKRKLAQVRELGCHSFALLFDDIDAELRGLDRQVFQSSAHAQAQLTNEVYAYLSGLAGPSVSGPLHRFLFCPTEYCGTRAVPSVRASGYLATLGQKLQPAVDIMWTGCQVVSRVLGPAEVAELAAVLRRPPLIWDNLHANDYDARRLYLGPYGGGGGRPAGLAGPGGLRGVLTNPNCEFEANYIPIHTLAQWARCGGAGGADAPEYQPRDALTVALKDWLEVVHRSEGVRHQAGDSASVTFADLAHLVDLFHLPFEYGSAAESALDTVRWLCVHWRCLERDAIPGGLRSPAPSDTTAEISAPAPAGDEVPTPLAWRQRLASFCADCERVTDLCARLSRIPNRALASELHPYILDLQETLQLTRGYLQWLGQCNTETSRSNGSSTCVSLRPFWSWCSPGYKDVFSNGQYEPWVFRGGVIAEFQRMLSFEGVQELLHPPHPLPATFRRFSIRPVATDDRAAIIDLCRQNNAVDAPQTDDEVLSLGRMLSHPDCLGFVVQNAHGAVIAYAVAVLDASVLEARHTHQMPAPDLPPRRQFACCCAPLKRPDSSLSVDSYLSDVASPDHMADVSDGGMSDPGADAAADPGLVDGGSVSVAADVACSCLGVCRRVLDSVCAAAGGSGGFGSDLDSRYASQVWIGYSTRSDPLYAGAVSTHDNHGAVQAHGDDSAAHDTTVAGNGTIPAGGVPMEVAPAVSAPAVLPVLPVLCRPPPDLSLARYALACTFAALKTCGSTGVRVRVGRPTSHQLPGTLAPSALLYRAFGFVSPPDCASSDVMVRSI